MEPNATEIQAGTLTFRLRGASVDGKTDYQEALERLIKDKKFQALIRDRAVLIERQGALADILARNDEGELTMPVPVGTDQTITLESWLKSEVEEQKVRLGQRLAEYLDSHAG